MLSKEEIEKAKEFMKFYKNDCLNIEINNIENYETGNDGEFIYKNIETLLQYTDQLEQENNKLNKINNEMVDCIWNYDICEYEITDYTYRKCEYISDDEENPCKECIKQYFEKKVEKE